VLRGWRTAEMAARAGRQGRRAAAAEKAPVEQAELQSVPSLIHEVLYWLWPGPKGVPVFLR